ncbi:DNA-processing protein DprA [Labedella endophytica]|uniref:DNA-protecting protein DprA n=1 Tax=Labedella endophytica TaxID=1523160 RepID=A0A3S0VRA2_9MICO|nr:DNA-processing protein DprA [Labedella endophytica]RUQ97571.1 DNA-protecting protein DprA [Labedella endophytica]
MTVAGLSDARMAELAVPVADGDVTDESLQEIAARAAWSSVAEPGDGAAGGVVAALGASATMRLLSSRGSTARIRGLCEEQGLGEITEAVLSAWVSGVTRWRSRFDADAVVEAFGRARSSGARLAVPGSPSWPSRVDDLGVHAPLALWVRGRALAGEFGRSIALVGARAATGYGEHVTLEASSGLVDRGFAIVSGAAYGIDGMAHRAALADGGTTIAFLAGGVDRPYPSGHTALLARIATTGAVYAEVPCGVAPTKWRFLQRNRLIAAASAATVVLEAGARSGSLNTAGHASSLGRPLGAVPGPVTSVASAGCHRLLREYDATCVTSAAEMAELAASGSSTDVGGPGSDRPSRSVEAEQILGALSRRRAASVSELAEATGLISGDVQAVLGLLDLEGTVRESGGGWTRV